VYPPGPPKPDGSSNLFDGLDAAQLLSLEILLSFISAMNDRLEDGSDDWPEVGQRIGPAPLTIADRPIVGRARRSEGA
jgi:hypothetical protein